MLPPSRKDEPEVREPNEDDLAEQGPLEEDEFSGVPGDVAAASDEDWGGTADTTGDGVAAPDAADPGARPAESEAGDAADAGARTAEADAADAGARPAEPEASDAADAGARPAEPDAGDAGARPAESEAADTADAGARPAEPDAADAEQPDPWQLLKAVAEKAMVQAQNLGASTASELQLRTVFAHAEPAAVGLPNNLGISYCSATFGRGWQLRAALPQNLLLTHKYRDHVRFVVVVCDPDREDGARTLNYLQRELPHAIATGRLVLGTAQMEFWHCSVGKNCSHVMALETPWGHPGGVTPGRAPAAGGVTLAARDSGRLLDDNHILVNLDADNILDYHATETLVERMHYVPRNGGFRCSGKDNGVTGRIGARAKAFIQVGGYLETLLGSGAQDNDLWSAMKLLAGSAPRLRFPAGESIPNSKDAEAKNREKIKNCQPHASCTTWAKMNIHNCNMSRHLLDWGQWWRNYDSEPHKPPTSEDKRRRGGGKEGGGETREGSAKPQTLKR
ncbi:MAG: hypothetical protein GY772_10775 [bacterium]|nr:hypothetical protein [bacterium]